YRLCFATKKMGCKPQRKTFCITVALRAYYCHFCKFAGFYWLQLLAICNHHIYYTHIDRWMEILPTTYNYLFFDRSNIALFGDCGLLVRSIFHVDGYGKYMAINKK